MCMNFKSPPPPVGTLFTLIRYQAHPSGLGNHNLPQVMQNSTTSSKWDFPQLFLKRDEDKQTVVQASLAAIANFLVQKPDNIN